MLARQPAAQLLRRLASSGAVQSCRAFADSVAAEVPDTPPILGAAFLERFPVILPEPPQWEVDHHMYMHELRDRRQKHYPPEFIDEKRTIGGGATAAESAALWQPAPRRTEADEADDRRSTDRRLDERLILLLKSPSRGGGDGVWHLPYVEHQDSETIRESAERALQEATGGELRTFTVGNPPAAFHPLADGSGVLFYIRMQLLEGGLSEAAVPKGQRWYDFAWVAASELPEYFQHDPRQAALLQKVL